MVAAAVTEATKDAVPRGFKQTEIGLIPEDWESAPLGGVAQLVNGRGFKPFEWGIHGKPIIRIQNLNGSDELNYYEGQYNPKIEVENGQLLFAWSGSRGTSFGPHIWHGPTAVLNYHTWKIVHRPEKIQRVFLLHALRGLTEVIEAQAHGASALVHVQKWEMEGFLIPLPPLAEQEAIAGALSDADGAIRAVERALAKQRAVKQAALHALLTPTTRLPGFSGDWGVSTVGEQFSIQLGKMLDEEKNRGTYKPYIGNRAVQWGVIDLSEVNFVKLNERDLLKYRLQRGDLVVCEGGEVGRCAVWDHDEEFYFQKALHRLRPRGAYSTDLLKAYFELSARSGALSGIVTKTSIAHLPKGKLETLPIPVPPFEEQRAIVAVLSDMDVSIAALEARRDKLKAVKQGMMQTLLTGKVRLV